jgi:hypothetical protein
VEQRLEFLERGFEELQDLTAKVEDDLRKEIDEGIQAVTTERAHWEKVVAEFRLQARELAVGGIQLQIVGILCLVSALTVPTLFPVAPTSAM